MKYEDRTDLVDPGELIPSSTLKRLTRAPSDAVTAGAYQRLRYEKGVLGAETSEEPVAVLVDTVDRIFAYALIDYTPVPRTRWI